MLQALANGLLEGLLFAVLSVAFSLVYATTRVFYIALGGVYALAPYVLLAVMRHGLHWSLGLVLSVMLCSSLSILCEEWIHWPFERKHAPDTVHFIGSLGAFLIIVQTIALIWGNDVQMFHAGVDEVYIFGKIRLTQSQAVGGVVATLVLAVLFVWIWRSPAGLKFRALADNPPLLAVFGMNVRRLRRFAFGLSGALTALVAILAASDVGFDPNVGMSAVLVSVAATILGGASSFASVAVAGLLLGLLRAQVVWHTSTQWEDAVTFAVLALCLFFLPGGLRSLVINRKRLEASV